MIKEDNLEFSFSGLKSAFINLHHNAEQKGESLSKEDPIGFLPSGGDGYLDGQDQKKP